jgi:hypothetical protein
MASFFCGHFHGSGVNVPFMCVSTKPVTLYLFNCRTSLLCCNSNLFISAKNVNIIFNKYVYNKVYNDDISYQHQGTF